MGRMDAFRLWPSIAAMQVLIASVEPEKRWISCLLGALTMSVALLALAIGYPRANPMIEKISSQIASETNRGDRVWVGPFRPLSYCLAQRLPASRYYFILPWTATDEVRRQVIADISRSPPNLIVIDDTGGFQLAQILPEMSTLLAMRYHTTQIIGGAIFYRRNSGVSHVAS